MPAWAPSKPIGPASRTHWRLSRMGVCQLLAVFIVGADGETRESLDRLGQVILDSSLADVQITVQTPFPGTPLFQHLQKQGRLLPDRGWPFYTLFDVTYQPDRMRVAELETGYRSLIRQVFNAEATCKRTASRKKIWQQNPRLSPWASELSPVT